MENLTKEVISILQYLLPGFISLWVINGLTSSPKKEKFDQIIQALIFTVLIQAIIESIHLIGKLLSLDPCPQIPTIVWSVICGLIIGILFSYFINSDKFHWLMRKWKITKQTSYPSEWFGSFLENTTEIVLHMKDGRRLHGWPKEWPSDPKKGHFLLFKPSWLVKENEKVKVREVRIEGVENILIDVSDVKWVEFLEKETNE